MMPTERIPPAPSYAELTEQLAAWRGHASDDCAALRRVGKLVETWEAGAVGPSITATMHRELAAEVRRAVAGDG